MAKQESIPFLTPWFTARYPKISKPDTKGKFADGKFKTDGVFLTEEGLQEATEALEAAAKHFWPDADVVTMPIKDFFANKEDRAAGKVEARGITLKSKYRPAVFDGKKKKLPESVAIGGGSIIRVAAFVIPYDKTTKIKEKDPKTGKVVMKDDTEYGISLRLGDVQVRKLVEFQAQGDGSAFDEDEEGFTYEGEEDNGGEQFGEATDL